MAWVETLKQLLEHARLESRVDHRSLEAQGVDHD